MHPVAQTPPVPYYAVIFTSIRAATGAGGYEATADRMLELAAGQPGFLGAESVRDGAGVGITVSYWSSLDAIGHWKQNAEHRVAQELGRTTWYSEYRLRICRVERDEHVQATI